MKTLIIDDEPGIRSLSAKVLARAGAVCDMAATGEEALERLAGESFDIVLVDIRLPGIDGLTLASRVHDLQGDIAIVMVTGMSDAPSVIAAMHAGAVDYVVKPFGAEALTRAYQRAAERRRVNLAAGRASGLQRVVTERTLEIRVLLGDHAETPDGLVRSYLAALRMRDGAAADHAARVATLTRTLATSLGLTADADLVERAALLHDIGKFALPDSLLGNPRGLDADTLQVVRRFPEFGHDVLRGVESLSDCAPIVLAQLEHYDGTGTPLGLRGERIPLGARVLSVANVYDVMTHPRAHAKQQTSLEALQEIEACAGTQFDPAVVRQLLEHFGVAPALDDWADSAWR